MILLLACFEMPMNSIPPHAVEVCGSAITINTVTDEGYDRSSFDIRNDFETLMALHVNCIKNPNDAYPANWSWEQDSQWTVEWFSKH